MTDHLLRTIADLEEDVRRQEQAVGELKRTINHLCRRAGIAAKFTEADLAIEGGLNAGTSPNIQPDEYTGKPLNTAIKIYLSMRKATLGTGPASAEEIHEALVRGGYEFDGKDKAAILNGLRISLGKSSNTFKKLPNGLYGLNEWYGITKPKRSTNKDSGSDPGNSSNVVTDADSEGGSATDAEE